MPAPFSVHHTDAERVLALWRGDGSTSLTFLAPAHGGVRVREYSRDSHSMQITYTFPDSSRISIRGRGNHHKVEASS